MHAILIGAGNIGSSAAQYLARTPEVSRLTIVDPDVYEARNLANQAILASDVGRPKAEAQARRLRRINTRLEVESVVSRVEDIPLGLLRSDILIAAVDTRLTRQYINEAAWTLGVPWIDSGVHADGGLVRISAYRPGFDLPCLECSWEERHYALLEARFACGANSGVHRTNAPAGLGGLAGALLAIEAAKLLAGNLDGSLAGRELVIDSRYHKQHVVTMPRNANCRFSHETPQIEAGFPVSATVGSVVESAGPLSLVAGAGIVSALACAHCQRRASPWRLVRAMRPSDRRCPQCIREMPVTGFGVSRQIDASAPKKVLGRTLARLGFCEGDVAVTMGGGSARYWQLKGD